MEDEKKGVQEKKNKKKNKKEKKKKKKENECVKMKMWIEANMEIVKMIILEKKKVDETHSADKASVYLEGR